MPHRKLWALMVLLILNGGACTRGEREFSPEIQESVEAPPPRSFHHQEKAPPEFRIEPVGYKEEDLGCAASVCPAGIGFLIAEHHKEGGGRQLQACSAFLISPDTVMTAAHCIPEDLRAAGIDVSARIALKFWNQPAPLTVTVQAANLSERLAPDFAVLKLSVSFPRPLKISRAGFAQHEPVTVMYWRKTSPTRRMLSMGRCQALQNSSLFPLFKNNFHPTVALADCDFEITPGHSGSPVLDQAGLVIGVLGSFLETNDLPVSLAMNPDDAALIPRLGLAANLACVDGYSPQPACRAIFREQDLYAEIRRLAQQAIQQGQPGSQQPEIEEWLKQNSKIIQWKIGPDPEFQPEKEIFTTAPSRPIPECFRPPQEWIAEFRSYGWFVQNEAKIRGQIVRWGTGVSLSGYGPFQTAAVAVPLGPFVIQFNPKELADTGATTVRMASFEDRIDARVAVQRQYDLKICR